ncbi:MAG: hypothetical protein IJ604_06230 [Prevotella sp.]|nr:hypothetical protein [Prevotella sp.]
MKLKNLLYTVLAGFMAIMVACSPESDSLGAVDLTAAQLAEGTGFTVDVDQNTNQVVFRSLLPSSYSVYWEYGPKPANDAERSISGTSNNSVYQVGIAFDGEYYVRMAAQTRGGIVYSEPANFRINEMNPELLSDPLWNLLSGGIGNSKTWVLDIDADGNAIKFGGPKWFYTSGQSWDSFHNAKGENYIDSKSWDASTAIDPTYSGEWYWAADWAGNGWICGAADYGEMTFDLIGGANVDVNGTKGAYNLDVDAHTISFTGAIPLSCGVESNIAAQCPAGTYKIIYLTENAMQILFDGDSETPFTMNYVSKEYKDNYVPPVITTITLPEDWKDYIQPKNQKNTSYKFSDDTPFTWFTLAGEEIARNGFEPHGDLSEFKLELRQDAVGAPTGKMVVTNLAGDGTEIAYTLSDGGQFSLQSALPSFVICSNNNDIKFGSTDNTLQIIKYEMDDYSGDISDLWIGSRQYDAQGNAYCYLGYHLKKQTGGAEVERLKSNLNYSDTGWTFTNSEDVYITGDGDYTYTLYPNSSNTQDPYLMYLDVYKLLKSHPNADIVLKSIKVDGNEVLGSEEGMDDATVSRGVGDDATTGRRYILNPWNEESATHTHLFKFSTTIEVTVSIKFDTGGVVLQ